MFFATWPPTMKRTRRSIRFSPVCWLAFSWKSACGCSRSPKRKLTLSLTLIWIGGVAGGFGWGAAGEGGGGGWGSLGAAGWAASAVPASAAIAMIIRKAFSRVLINPPQVVVGDETTCFADAE